MSDPFAGRDASPFGRRQRRPRGARLPVTVVTGFLGAGKTTLIRELLAKPEGANTAVVVNEFGEVGIDHALLRSSSDTTVLLGNGCVCCAVRTDLQESLRTLFAERGRGAVPSFERVIIETSGLADPGPVLQTIASDRALGDVFHLQGLIAVVDAPGGAGNLDQAPEARQQVALADRIVLTKTDLADNAAAAALTDRLGALSAAPVATEGSRGPVVVHAVQHVAHRPVELLDWPDSDRRSRLVFITRNLAKARVEQLFAVIAAIGPNGPPGNEILTSGP